MLNWHVFDLHIHSALSPCADDDMTPPRIITQCAALGVSLIAICDHNSCANAAAFVQAAQGTDVTVLPGMELMTREEVHLLCLFEGLKHALAFDGVVRRHSPDLRNRSDLFGYQRLLDPHGQVIGEYAQMLSAASDLCVEEAWSTVEEFGGLAIPAHVDRPSFSLLAQLGLLPVGLPVTALELSQSMSRSAFICQHPSLACYPMIHGSDAHRLGDLYAPRSSAAYIKEPTLAELRYALLGRDERMMATDLLTSSDI